MKREVCFRLFILLSALNLPLYLIARSPLKKGAFIYQNDTLRYQYHLPKDDGTKKPVILWLHGKGERERDNEKPFANGLPAIYDSIRMNEAYDCFLLVPQCNADGFWSFYDKTLPRFIQSKEAPPIQKLLLAWIDDWFNKHFTADKNRFYGMGISMGGFGIWDIAIKHPNLFAAIVPVCGGADPTLARNIETLPVWAFHGAKDKVVNPLFTIQIMEELNTLQSPDLASRFSLLPEVGHNAWIYLQEEPYLLRWLFSKQKF
ncbi:MAG: prolyl oligopeptidase family serine peptidase [Flavobacteriales bacterium]|nr:prolyl oligopeptidase family serine peptidase [Flavobacteriales bacterium]